MIICLERGAYGPADATATPPPLVSVKSRMVHPSGTSLSRLTCKRAVKPVVVHVFVVRSCVLIIMIITSLPKVTW